MFFLARSGGVPALVAILAPCGAAQSFVLSQGALPPNTSAVVGPFENVDFADVDLDGDWDAAIAVGGANGDWRNRLWVNLGGAQGGTIGHFVDRTLVQFPTVNDESRDVEFADIDADLDPDLFVANSSYHTPEPSRWWVNQGMSQGGTAGFYTDETATRWVGLGGPASSVPGSLVLPGGGFENWSTDGDFADVDDDGDLDLLLVTHFPFAVGNVPTRIFLNDGNGYFQEWNPGGTSLASAEIPDGTPAPWAEGVQMQDTNDSTGASCDVAAAANDADFGDLDGDFDLDILLGDQMSSARIFRNLRSDSGTAVFRDVTSASFTGVYEAGNAHYEQELGDLDGDSNLDIYGLSWLNNLNFQDVSLRGNGDGTFQPAQVVPGAVSDAEEADWFDFDGDGDLDVFVAIWAGRDLVVRNDAGSLTADPSQIPTTVPGYNSRDADACDLDGDGDYDVVSVGGSPTSSGTLYYRNVTQVPDTHAPYIPRVEQAPHRTAGPAPTVVHAHVYDNAPYYITQYHQVFVSYRLDGGPPVLLPARWSGGQVFRAEIPGSAVGVVSYRFVARDEHGNDGASETRHFVAVSPITTGTAFCVCTGSGAAPPCGNFGFLGSGCGNSAFPEGARLSGHGPASVANDELRLLAERTVPGQPGLFLQGNQALAGGAGLPFGDGLRCVGGGVLRLETAAADSDGFALSTAALSAAGGVQPGDVRRYQWWYRDPVGSPCGSGFNLSNGLEVTWAP